MNLQRPVLRYEPHTQSAAFLGGFLLFAALAAAVGTQVSPFNIFTLFALIPLIFAVVVEINDRRYRLRLLPQGLRVTDCGSTTNLHSPEIKNPQAIGTCLELRLRSGDRELELRLSKFSRHDRALIVEHCSQFLTAEQQAEWGERWARKHAEWQKPPKPSEWRTTFLSLWRTVCVAAAVCIVGWPLLFELVHDRSLEIGSPWEVPEIRFLFYVVQIALVAAPLGFLVLGAACFGLDWLSRQAARMLPALCVWIRWLDHDMWWNLRHLWRGHAAADLATDSALPPGPARPAVRESSGP